MHEFGHHIGIPDDMGAYGSVMKFGSIEHPRLDAFTGDYAPPTLQYDDIRNAQKIYGCRSTRFCLVNIANRDNFGIFG